MFTVKHRVAKQWARKQPVGFMNYLILLLTAIDVEPLTLSYLRWCYHGYPTLKSQKALHLRDIEYSLYICDDFAGKNNSVNLAMIQSGFS